MKRFFSLRFLRGSASALVILLVLVVGGLHACAPKWLPHAIVAVPNTGQTIDPANDPSPDQLLELGIDHQLRAETGPPEASIAFWVIDPPADREIAGTLLILHGLNDGKASMRPLGRWFADQGFRVVVVDLRGHGRSSGQYASFGVFDGHDIQAVLDKLESEGLLAGGAGIFGHSYGGASAIQAAAVDPRVRGVVSVSAFSSMRAVVPGYVRKYVPILGWTISKQTISDAVDDASSMVGFDPDNADTAASLARTNIPVLLIHGTADKHIPYEHGQTLHAAAADRCELWLIPGETHYSTLSGASGEAVLERAVEFFQEVLAEP